jgi:hypothetical protein
MRSWKACNHVGWLFLCVMYDGNRPTWYAWEVLDACSPVLQHSFRLNSFRKMQASSMRVTSRLHMGQTSLPTLCFLLSAKMIV